MTKNTLIIGILFFGFPVFLFIGSYYYEFQKQANQSNNLSLDENRHSIILHRISGNQPISISGKIQNRIGHSSLEISDLEISNKLDNKTLLRFGPKSVCRVELKDDCIDVTEIMRLPVGKSWKWKKVEVLMSRISLNEENKLVINEKSLLKIPHSLKIKFEKLKDEIEERSTKGFKDISQTIKSEYLKTFIGKLLICSISGDSKSLDVLRNFEAYFSEKLEGHNLEWYNEVLCKANSCCE